VPRDTLVDFFHDLAQAPGEFLIHDDGFRSRHFSYREVGAAARGFAARLNALGIGKGDKVVFFSENRPEWIVAFWGCLIAGVVVVPIDYRSSPDFLARVRRIVAARLVLVGDEVPDITAEDIPIWPFREPSSIAYGKKADVDANYARLMERLLDGGNYPAIATHDAAMIDVARRYAVAHQIGSDRFEFQMLYGIRRDLQSTLVRDGYRVRVYIPFGRQWFPYFMRRLGERPANIGFVIRGILREKD